MKYILYILGSALILLNYSCTYKNGLSLNKNASIDSLGDLPENPLLLNAITTSISPKDGTTTVLYGNVLAYNHAADKGNAHYPIGAVLYEVTWYLQSDEQWFGANVPERIKTVERIEFMSNNETQYTSFKEGLKEPQPHNQEERISNIIRKKIATVP